MHLTTGDIAKRLNVHMRTVLDWINKGHIKAYRTPGRHCRVTVSDYRKFLKKFGMKEM